MTMKATAQAIQTLLKAVDSGGSLIFDRVWIGEPNKIPLNKYTATIRASEDTDFQDTTCGSRDHYRREWQITIYVPGTVETAESNLYDARDLVRADLKNNPTLSGACTDSNVSQILYGEYGTETRLVGVARFLYSTFHDETLT